MEGQEQQPIHFEDLPIQEQRGVYNKTLDEMYTRLDHGRMMGVDINRKGRSSTPLRSEEAANEEKVKDLYKQIKNLSDNVREHSPEPRKVGEYYVHEFKKDNCRIRVPVEGDEQSRIFLGGDANIRITDDTKILTFRHIFENGGNDFMLEIKFLDDGDFEGLTYDASSAKEPMNKEEYIVSYMMVKQSLEAINDKNPTQSQ